MAFIEKLFPVNNHHHLEERQPLLRKLEFKERKFVREVLELTNRNREGVRVSRYEIPNEALFTNRLTSSKTEIRVDINLSSREMAHAPAIIKETFHTLGARLSDLISVGIIFADDNFNAYYHFGLILVPDHRLKNRVALALSSDAELPSFAVGNIRSNGKYEYVCKEFSAGKAGLWDIRITDILYEGVQWLPKIIVGRKVVSY